ncbi:MAG: 3-phosphoserine/phosphohydroxythreonine transaminase [Pirellulales bacterium]|nr:3-phosphoserine/phosphohydroxythreonine transaminase [Pirellulales bacterium]
MTPRVFNFSPGPAVLPLSVLEQAQRDMLGLPGIGISPLEISHRHKWFDGVLATTKSLMRELLGIPANYQIVFMQGGSNLQFSMLPMNFLRGTNLPADYVVTGTWGSKAVAEAQREGTVNVAWDGKKSNYNHLPPAAEVRLSPQAAYTHITTNETIQGVQFPANPDFGAAPLIADMSSDFLCRPLDVSKYALIYACAQKNAGIAGVTIAIIRDDLLERIPAGLPTMLDYRTFSKNDSVFNTPPVFAIYVFQLVLQWLKNDIGGLAKMQSRNVEKCQLLYEVLDGKFYEGHAATDCRSLMNVTFRLPSEELEKAFIKGAEARQLFELKGHRSVGGMRASIYNAMPLEGVRLLRDWMVEFRGQHA